MADRAHFFQLLEVIPVTHAVLVHHVQHNLTRAALLHFLHPVQRFPLGDTRPALITGILVDVIFTGCSVIPGVDPNHNALHAKAIGQTGNQLRVGQGRGVDGNLVGTKRENFGRVVSGLNPARDTERNINHFRHARDPAFVDHATIA